MSVSATTQKTRVGEILNLHRECEKAVDVLRMKVTALWYRNLNARGYRHVKSEAFLAQQNVQQIKSKLQTIHKNQKDSDITNLINSLYPEVVARETLERNPGISRTSIRLSPCGDEISYADTMAIYKSKNEIDRHCPKCMAFVKSASFTSSDKPNVTYEIVDSPTVGSNRSDGDRFSEPLSFGTHRSFSLGLTNEDKRPSTDRKREVLITPEKPWADHEMKALKKAAGPDYEVGVWHNPDFYNKDGSKRSSSKSPSPKGPSNESSGHDRGSSSFGGIGWNDSSRDYT